MYVFPCGYCFSFIVFCIYIEKMFFAVLRLNSAVTKCCEDNPLFPLEIMLNLDSFLLTICIHVLHYIHNYI